MAHDNLKCNSSSQLLLTTRFAQPTKPIAHIGFGNNFSKWFSVQNFLNKKYQKWKVCGLCLHSFCQVQCITLSLPLNHQDRHVCRVEKRESRLSYHCQTDSVLNQKNVYRIEQNFQLKISSWICDYKLCGLSKWKFVWNGENVKFISFISAKLICNSVA